MTASDYSPRYQCTREGCTDVAVNGHLCVMHEKRWWK